ncbi:UNVERIFIED_CONTAM: hypothetical protein HDU68_001428 [Siphonaria sp. JEL0065]|nr:hypothetical protein HDU68_001428 [Siphonaria sp. JEL0065]
MHKVDETTREFKNWWDTIMYYEEMILAELCWDVSVDFPYEWILRMSKGVGAPPLLKETAWALVNDSYRQPLCLAYASNEIAAACMIVAQILIKTNNANVAAAAAAGNASVPKPFTVGRETAGSDEEWQQQQHHEIPAVDTDSAMQVLAQSGTDKKRVAAQNDTASTDLIYHILNQTFIHTVAPEVDSLQKYKEVPTRTNLNPARSFSGEEECMNLVLLRADVVFVNNYALDAKLNFRILERFLDLKEGAMHRDEGSGRHENSLEHVLDEGVILE